MLPKHGKINCQECFEKSELICQPHSKWRLRNDPGAWGSSEPAVLVLGFSKGSTQTDIYSTGKFEDVAFGGQARNRLDRILKSVNLIPNNSHVSNLIESPSQKLIAFGSLVRCSLSRQDDRSGNWLTSGNLILKSFNEVPDILSRCSKKYVANLPEKTRTIALLGVTEAYIKQCYQLLKNLYPNLQWINQVAYRSEDRLFVHLTHPSPGNGTYQAWIDGAPKQQLATEALSERNLVDGHTKAATTQKITTNGGESKVSPKVISNKSIGTYDGTEEKADRFSSLFYLLHESGDQLFPVRMKNRETGELSFRVSPGGKGGNTKNAGIEVDDEVEMKRYVIERGYAVRASTLDRSRNGLFKVGQKSISRAVEKA